MKYGELREEFVMEPVTGKAVPVYKGEVIRIIQVKGGQCVDFNGFNLHDYKEHVDCGFTRAIHGFSPKKGDFVWTQASRGRPMFAILEMPKTCQSETLGARCNAVYFEVSHGFDIHTNCQDTLAEAIREYGLTPDDVHDSFNMWMNTVWDLEGNLYLTKNSGKAGDYVDLLALFDVLAVPNVCGSGDIMITSNFSFKPIKVQVFKASEETLSLVNDHEKQYMGFKNQRTPSQFKISNIKYDREITRDPNYEPDYVNYPLIKKEIEVELTPAEYKLIDKYRKMGDFGQTDGEIVRAGFFIWWAKHKTRKFLKFGYIPSKKAGALAGKKSK